MSELHAIFRAFDGHVLAEAVGCECDQPLAPDDPVCLEERYVLSRLDVLSIALIGHRMNSGTYYSDNVPGFFIGLLSPLREVQTQTLQQLRFAWERVLRAEELALKSPWWRDFLAELYWTRCTWHREVLVMLQERNFEAVVFGGKMSSGVHEQGA